jgi:hypothetical protein
MDPDFVVEDGYDFPIEYFRLRRNGYVGSPRIEFDRDPRKQAAVEPNGNRFEPDIVEIPGYPFHDSIVSEGFARIVVFQILPLERFFAFREQFFVNASEQEGIVFVNLSRILPEVRADEFFLDPQFLQFFGKEMGDVLFDTERYELLLNRIYLSRERFELGGRREIIRKNRIVRPAEADERVEFLEYVFRPEHSGEIEFLADGVDFGVDFPKRSFPRHPPGGNGSREIVPGFDGVSLDAGTPEHERFANYCGIRFEADSFDADAPFGNVDSDGLFEFFRECRGDRVAGPVQVDPEFQFHAFGIK